MLTDKIVNLISRYKLTINELAGYLVEQPDIKLTEYEIEQTIKDLIQSQQIAIENSLLQNGELLRPANFDSMAWNSISREDSKKWVEDNTNLNSFFHHARYLHNNLIKQVKSNYQYNPYYQIYNPTANLMEVDVKGKKGVMFACNDYLGLSRHPDVIKACQEAVALYGNGSCGSRITVGTTDLHLKLEQKLAKFKNKENSIIFSSGYITNLSFFSTLAKDTTVFFDSLVHACIIDGIRLSGVNAIRFKHNDMDDLEGKLKKYPLNGPKLIVVESVYSLDGDIAKISDIVQLAKMYNTKLAVDEAHSTGTLGAMGRGIAEMYCLPPEAIDFTIGTLGKAIGAEGGFLCASQKTIEAYNYSARPYMYTTSRAFPVIAGALKALELIENKPQLISQLQKNAAYVRQAFIDLGIDIGHSASQIIPIMTYSNDKTYLLHKALEENGIYTVPVVYPSVPPKKSRVRVNISAVHTKEHLDKLTESVAYESKKLGII